MIVQALATLYHLQKLCNVVGDPEEHAEFRSNIRHFNHHLAESAKYQAVLGLVAANISHIPCTEVRKPYAGLPKPGFCRWSRSVSFWPAPAHSPTLSTGSVE